MEYGDIKKRHMKKTALSGFFLILLVYAAFIALGLPDGLMGVAWPSIRADFGLPIDAIGIMMATLTIGYLVSSTFSGRLIYKFGVGLILAASCIVTGVVLAAYCAAGSWLMFVLLGLGAGLGAGAIDAGLNTYVAANLAKKHMHWLHASYGIGAMLGPFIMTAALMYFNRWRVGYVTVAVLQVLLGLCFIVSMKSWSLNHDADIKEGIKFTDYNTPMIKTLSHPPVWVSIILVFLYTGAEGTIGFWIYSLLTESRGVESAVAGIWTGIYWAVFTLGRVFAGFYSTQISINALVLLSLLLALCGSVLLWLNVAPLLNLAGIVLTGLAIAPIFPSLISGTKNRVGEMHAGNTIGMQMASAGLGVATVPALAGVIAGKSSLEAIPVFLIILFTSVIMIYLTFVREKKGETSWC